MPAGRKLRRPLECRRAAGGHPDRARIGADEAGPHVVFQPDRDRGLAGPSLPICAPVAGCPHQRFRARGRRGSCLAAVLLRRLGARRARRPVLAGRLAGRPALLGAHGPAHAAARHRADPRHPRLHEGAPAARHAHRLGRRAPCRPGGAPRLRGRLVRRRDLGMARSRRLRRRRAPQRHPRGRAPQLPDRGLPVLVASDLADPGAHAPRRHGADRLHGDEQGAPRRPRDGDRLRAHGALLRLRPHRSASGVSPSWTTRASPG